MRIPNLVLSTIILFISNLIVRLLGFLYKIFLSRAMGDVGLGTYHMIFNFLMICIALTTTGIPTALSCLIAKENALKDKKDANIFFISTLYVAFFISLFISLLVSFNSTYLSFKLLQDKNLNLFILSICPAIVIITISNVLRGYFYGIKKVMVPAIGQVIEQITRILFVFLLAMYISDKAMICYVTLMGISIGESINVIYMTICLYKESSLYNSFTIKLKDFYHASMETLKMALPITCNKMSSVVLQSVSSMIVPSRLALCGISYTQCIGLYGIVNGMVMPFVYLPFTIGSALIVNLIPSISQEVTLNKIKNVKIKIYYAVVLTVGVGVVSALFFYFFGEELCLIVFNNKTAGTYLKAMFLAPLFLSLNQTLSGILHAIRKEIISSVNTILAMVIQVVAIYFLLPVPSLNMYAYIYAITVTAIFTTILHSIVLIRALRKL